VARGLAIILMGSKSMKVIFLVFVNFIGIWKNDRRNGEGISYYLQVAGLMSYFGNWYKDTRHGVGKQFDIDGSLVASGMWVENKFIGK
jgi:hypothetical protein